METIKGMVNVHKIEAVCIAADCCVALCGLFGVEFEQLPLEKIGIAGALGAGIFFLGKHFGSTHTHGKGETT